MYFSMPSSVHPHSVNAECDSDRVGLSWTARLSAKFRIKQLLAVADIRVDGRRPWDLNVKDERFYRRLIGTGSIGLGDSYVDGWWDCDDLEDLFSHILIGGLDRYSTPISRRFMKYAVGHDLKRSSRRQSQELADKHYDLGNDLYQQMLDKRLVYTSARWKQASNLEEAQEEKLHAVCERLALEPGMRLLDIGCGWGSLAKFATENYGTKVVGITISTQQLALGRSLCAGLPIELGLEDYREVHGSFDRVASLGMFEHVGSKNYRTYFEIVHRLLRDNGLFYLATIGASREPHEDDPWIQKSIFPNSHIPSWDEITRSVKGLFVVESRENWASDYERTVQAWLHNFEQNWEQLRARQDGERFRRMWRYYLSAAAATFRSNNSAAWQLVLSPVS